MNLYRLMTAGMMMVVVDGNKKGAICYMKAIYRLSNTTKGARFQRNSRQRWVKKKKTRAAAPAGRREINIWLYKSMYKLISSLSSRYRDSGLVDSKRESP